METTEKIVEAYARYIKRWATIPNIKCSGQHEIDLLALDPVKLKRYHIESGVSISGSFSKLTSKPFSEDKLRNRVKQSGQRRTLGYFAEKKFGDKDVIETLEKYGFAQGNYTKVIVSWGWTEEAAKDAVALGIELWDFRKIVQEIGSASMDKRSYFADDTIRTIQLFGKALLEEQ